MINDRGSATIEPAAKQHKAGHCRLILAPQLDVDKHLDEGIEVHVASAQLVGLAVRTEAETGHVDLKNYVTHEAAIPSIPVSGQRVEVSVDKGRKGNMETLSHEDS